MAYKALCQAVESGKVEEAEDLTHKLLDEGKEPLDMIAVLTETMDKLGESFARLEIFLPQLVFAGDALKAVTDILKPKIMEAGKQQASKGKVVLGVVKGDVHEIGKNIVKLCSKPTDSR